MDNAMNISMIPSCWYLCQAGITVVYQCYKYGRVAIINLLGLWYVKMHYNNKQTIIMHFSWYLCNHTRIRYLFVLQDIHVCTEIHVCLIMVIPLVYTPPLQSETGRPSGLYLFHGLSLFLPTCREPPTPVPHRKAPTGPISNCLRK